MKITPPLVIVGIIIFIATLLILTLNKVNLSQKVDDMQCRFRLKRLGIAVNQWVIDQGHQRFPKIKNPTTATPWDPNRLASAHAILGEYLRGDIPFRRMEDESSEAFYQRRLKNEMTVDPRTGYEFWYNPLMADLKPESVKNDSSDHWYFRTQRNSNGEWGYEHGGTDGSWMVVPSLVQRQITSDDLISLRERLNELERINAGKPQEKWTHDLPFLRDEVLRLETLHREKGEVLSDGSVVVTQIALEQKVRFEDGEKIIRTR